MKKHQWLEIVQMYSAAAWLIYPTALGFWWMMGKFGAFLFVVGVTHALMACVLGAICTHAYLEEKIDDAKWGGSD